MDFHIKGCFDLTRTLSGGQCFRWRREPDGSWHGFSGARPLRLRQETDGVTLLNVREEDLPYWNAYFDLNTDYEAILRKLSADETLRRASEENRGLRILRQEPFETLISFILSQNNNIPRIRAIVERLCRMFGEPVSGGFAFPLPERLASADERTLSPLRAGFRTRYLLDAAQKVCSGEVRLAEIGQMDYEAGKAELKKIVGVGEKVADCVLLFAYHKTEAFPADVWIKRIVAEYYKDGLPECAQECRGVAQQYLFEYFRAHGISPKGKEDNHVL